MSKLDPYRIERENLKAIRRQMRGYIGSGIWFLDKNTGRRRESTIAEWDQFATDTANGLRSLIAKNAHKIINRPYFGGPQINISIPVTPIPKATSI